MAVWRWLGCTATGLLIRFPGVPRWSLWLVCVAWLRVVWSGVWWWGRHLVLSAEVALPLVGRLWLVRGLALEGMEAVQRALAL